MFTQTVSLGRSDLVAIENNESSLKNTHANSQGRAFSGCFEHYCGKVISKQCCTYININSVDVIRIFDTINIFKADTTSLG